jgi:hypothetical protein
MHFKHPIRSSPSWRRTLMIAATMALLAGAAGTTASAAGPGPVVGPAGTVAGHGYSYWAGVANRIFFSHGGAPPLCQTLHSHGQEVEFLDGVDAEHTIRCRVRAREPIYVHGITQECSTIAGDHKGFGTSARQLERCARQQFRALRLRGTASVDGVAVSNYAELSSAAPVVDVRLPKHNAFHLPPLRLKSAAYGEGLLLSGLAVGTHTIVVKSFTPGGNQQRTFVVRVS